MSSIVAYDTETWLVEPGRLAPPLVCLSYQWLGDKSPELVDRHEAVSTFRLFLHRASLIIGYRLAYDNAVMCAADPTLIEAVFECYSEGVFTDIRIRERLLSIRETGEANPPGLVPGLKGLVKKYTGRELEKGTWQLGYKELYDTPLQEWPRGAIEYAKEDARGTLDVWREQNFHAGLSDSEYITDEREQAAYDFALHLVSAWGIKTDPVACARLRKATQLKIDSARDILLHHGLLTPVMKGRGKAKFPTGEYKKEQKLAQEYAERSAHSRGLELPRTPTGKPQLTEDAVKDLGDPVLQAYQTYASSETHLSRVEAFEKGTVTPINTRFEVLLATGRTSSSAPNIQNLSRDGGERECFVPRPGNVFVAADYSSLELHTLAETCVTLLGKSRLAEVLNSGVDAHLAMAAEIMGRPLAELDKAHPEVKAARQFAKIANFGFPGGLSPRTLCKWAKTSYGVILEESRALELQEQWFRTWPEMRDYFSHLQEQADAFTDTIEVTQISSGRVRGSCTFTQAANSYFQGLGSDCAKTALLMVVHEQYVDQGTALFGTRTVNFVHDEIICEASEEEAHETAVRLGELMEAAGKHWMPNCPPKAKPFLMRRWIKGAEAVFGGDGRLIPWEDVEGEAA